MKQQYYSKGPNFNDITLKMYTPNDEFYIPELICDKIFIYFVNDIENYYYISDIFKLEIYKNNELIHSYDESSNDLYFSDIKQLIESLLYE